MPRASILVVLLLACGPAAPTSPSRPVPAPPARAADGVRLEALTENASVHGFTVAARYTDDADQPIGARFIHAKTHFTFDYLRVETAPQGYLWVRSFPTSDQGEPHTQEHLLLGKGDRGRKLGSREAMALVESTAFTAQWHTAYHFHTDAGNDVFWPVFADHLDALLNPDYTDEEIRREVRNFGVDKGPTGALRLEEKGTVYNEMVRTHEQPETALWRGMGHLLYGANHPLALDSGGYPSAIRTMTPSDIRTFHQQNYHLANMGIIAAFPSAMKLDDVLVQTATILERAAGRTGPVRTEADLPAPAGAPAGTTQVLDYPYSDATTPGSIMYGWPATRHLDATEQALLDLFLSAFAGDESTTLYKLLVAGTTRAVDLGATAVSASLARDQGQPIYLTVEGVRVDKLDHATLTSVRTLIARELSAIAALPDGDPRLVAFTDRVRSRVIELRRGLAKFLDSPPRFGMRGTGYEWFDHLHALGRTPGFVKSLTLRPVLARVEQVLGERANPWRTRIKSWGLLDTPYALAVRPSPALRAQLDREREQRVGAELARLQKHYNAANAAEALARYQRDYDAASAALEAQAAAVELPPLVASVPLTLDDSLRYDERAIGATKAFVATFDTMASARAQLAFRVDGAVSADAGPYLAALPALLAGAGVIVDGKPLAAEDMRERVRREILELDVDYTADPRTKRLELVVTGGGNGAAEATAALGWMQRVMFAPDWRRENLPRLRDLIDQRITALRARMMDAEEQWVETPPTVWRLQDPNYAHVASFLTQQHDLHRLRWMLLDPNDPAATAQTVKFLGTLATARLTRAQYLELAQALAAADGKTRPSKNPALARWLAIPPAAAPLVRAAGKDLAQLLSDLPDSSLVADWAYLARQMAADLQVGADRALADLAALRTRLLNGRRARLVLVGSTATQRAIRGELEKLIASLPVADDQPVAAAADAPFLARLRARDPNAKAPRFFALVAPGTSSGVFVNTTPAPWFGDTGDDAVLDYLASNLYTGHGAHSIFLKTWAAGLAYSNGLRPQIENGQLVYYAERTPLLPTTLRFVIDELRRAKPDANIARYAVASAFASRGASAYETRAAALAADLADGQTPAIVKAFRTKIVEEAQRPDLAAKLFARMEQVYGRVLPGYGKGIDPRTTYFVIGPEKQLGAYEDYLRATYGAGTTLYRLYPRDFWIPR